MENISQLMCDNCCCVGGARYMNGAATNPDAHVAAYAAAQVKKGLDVAKKLGAQNFGLLLRYHKQAENTRSKCGP